MKRNWHQFSSIIILTGISLFYLITKINQNEVKEICYEEMQSSFSGRILRIENDSNNHPTSTIYFTNGYIFKGSQKHTYGLWIGLKSGDSIVKFKNTLKYFVYRDCNPLLVDTFFENLDCPQ